MTPSPDDSTTQIPHADIVHDVDKPLRVTPRMVWCWEVVEEHGLDAHCIALLLRIAWRARYGSYSATHEQLAVETGMYEQTVRKRLRLLISKGLLFQRKTYGDGNTYYPIGEPWPYSGVSAQLGMNLSRSGVSSRNDPGSHPGRSGVSSRNDPGSHPGRSGVSSRNDPYRENEFLTNEENEPPPNARALRATRAREGQGTAAVSQPKISQEFGEDLRDRERAIEALSEVLPPSQWHPAWADVVAREWLDVLDAFDDYKVDNPVGTLVRRLQKLAAEHDLTVPPADSLAGRGVPVKRQQKPLSYREYFRG